MSLYPSGRFESARNLVVHELGHAFNGGHGSVPMNAMPGGYVSKRSEILAPNVTIMYQLHIDPTSRSETFADFFVAWTFDVWQTDTKLVGPASAWMNDSMAGWLP